MEGLSTFIIHQNCLMQHQRVSATEAFKIIFRCLLRHVILRRSAHYYDHSEGGLSRYTFDMITRVPILIQPRHDEYLNVWSNWKMIIFSL